MYENDRTACPSCGEIIPRSAYQCKHCLTTFSASVQTRRRSALPLLLLFVLSSALAFGTYHLFQVRSKRHYHFDQTSQTIMLLEKNANGIESKQIPFQDVVKVQHIIERKQHKLQFILQDTSKITFQVSKDELNTKAVYISSLIGVQLETIDRAG